MKSREWVGRGRKCLETDGVKGWSGRLRLGGCKTFTWVGEGSIGPDGGKGFAVDEPGCSC